MFEKALYYPHIEISDDRWLKSAALFWNTIETIVPESMDCPYRRRTTRTLEEERVLVAHRVNPFSEDVRGIELDVVKYMKTPEGKKSFRKPWLRSVVQNVNLLGDDFLPDKYRRILEEKYRDFYIHVDKLPLMLREQLAEQQDKDGFVWAREGFMTFYMTLLANRISRNNDMALLTKCVSYNNLSNKILSDRMTSGNINKQTKKAMMYTIMMDDIKIAPSTPIDDIIRFRNRRQNELARFRREMDRLTDFNSDGMSANDFENELKRIYEKQIVPAMNDVKTTLKDANILWLTGPGTCMFTGLIPALIGTDLSTTAGVITGICQGLGMTLSSIPVLKSWKAKRSPYTYLIKMRQEFSSAAKVGILG